jgi:DNA (cytosine-5)-methyltransferase 1
VDWRVLNAADYGDPTVRRRLFIQAVKGAGRTITWPESTHAEKKEEGRPAWIPARDIIDWSIHGESIFRRRKPLAPATIRRIEHGIERFWQPYAEPFLIMLRGTGTSRSPDKPLPAVTAQGKHIGLIMPFLINNYGQSKSASIDAPLPTVTGSSPKTALIEPFIIRFHGGQDSERRNHSIDDPLPVIDTSNRYAIVEQFILPNEGFYRGNKARSFKDRFGLVEPGGEFTLDIRFRMLQPLEEAAAMSFPKDYIFRGTKGDVQKQIGNAVPVNLSRELAQNILSIEVA